MCGIDAHSHLFSTTFVSGKQEARAWTKEEKRAVLSELGHLIREGRVPNKKESETCKEKSGGALDNRDWRGIKYWVKSQITKRKRAKSS